MIVMPPLDLAVHIMGGEGITVQKTYVRLYSFYQPTLRLKNCHMVRILTYVHGLLN